jgi:hypothetical protein
MNLLQIQVESNFTTASNSPTPPSLNHLYLVPNLLSAWWGWRYWQIRREVLVTGEELIKLLLHEVSPKLFNERGQSKGIKHSELLTSALDGGKFRASWSDHLTYKEQASDPHIHFDRRMGGSRSSLEAVKRNIFCPYRELTHDLSVVQPVV